MTGQPVRLVAIQASQPRLSDLRVGIMRTLPGEAGLLIRGDGIEESVDLAVGAEHPIPGHGTLTVVAVVPSTVLRRGQVELRFDPE